PSAATPGPHLRVPDLRTLGAPGDQHPTALHLQGCRNRFLLLSPLYCHQRNQWKKSPPLDCSINHSE
ncbi:hypothetical protein M9458_051391, partial [Cirrhinus mrigala]